MQRSLFEFLIGLYNWQVGFMQNDVFHNKQPFENVFYLIVGSRLTDLLTSTYFRLQCIMSS